MPILEPLRLNVPRDKASVEFLTRIMEELCERQRDTNWQLGDAVVLAKSMLGDDNWSQVCPVWASDGLMARCEAVSRAYKPDERNIEATWTIHMQNANFPDRVQRVQAHVEAGRTSDEAREANKQERQAAREEPQEEAPRGQGWLLAIDVHYYVNRFWFSGAGVEAASSVADWVERTVERLKGMGLTDVACCFDSKTNHRKELTKSEDWKDVPYKDRPPKDPEIGQQLDLVFDLLQKAGYACIKIEGMEADDCMASLAKQFPGKVTLLSQDKDLRQCLSGACNMLLDVEWEENDTTGEHDPVYKWYTQRPSKRLLALRDELSRRQGGPETEKVEEIKHAISQEPRNLWDDFGVTPEQWIDIQCLTGDNTDTITGARGIGIDGAKSLIQEFKSLNAAIEAARNDDPEKSPWKPHVGPRGGKKWKHEETGEEKGGKKRPDDRSKEWESLLDLAERLEITRQLITLRTDLDVDVSTKLT